MLLCLRQSLSEGVSGVLATRQHLIADPNPGTLKPPLGDPLLPPGDFSSGKPNLALNPEYIPYQYHSPYYPPYTCAILPKASMGASFFAYPP